MATPPPPDQALASQTRLIELAQQEWGQLLAAELRLLTALSHSNRATKTELANEITAKTGVTEPVAANRAASNAVRVNTIAASTIGTATEAIVDKRDRQLRASWIQWLLQILQTSFTHQGLAPWNPVLSRNSDLEANLNHIPAKNRLELPGITLSQGLRIQGVQILEQLDLSHWLIPFPLVFQDCEFLEVFRFQGAIIQELNCKKSQFPGIEGNHSQIQTDLTLEQTQIAGDLYLPHLLCRGQLNLDRARIHGTLTLAQAHLGGSLRLRGVQLQSTDPNGVALEAPNLHIGHSLYLQQGFRIQGRGNLTGACLGQDLQIGGGRWSVVEGVALGAGGLRVRRLALGLREETPLQIAGQVILAGARVAETLESQNCQLYSAQHGIPSSEITQPQVAPQPSKPAVTNPAKTQPGAKPPAVTLPNVTPPPVMLPEVGPINTAPLAEKSLISQDSDVLNPKILESDSISAAADPHPTPHPNRASHTVADFCSLTPTPSQPFYQPQFLLNAQNLEVKGDLLLHNQFLATGLVKLTGSWIGGHFICNASRFQNPGRVALDGERIQIQGDLRLRNGFAVAGWVRLNQAQIQGSLILYDLEQPETFKLDLQAAQVGWLQDEAQSWPPHGFLRLDGFRYDRLSETSPQDASSRLNWLRRMPQFYPQPYQQLAQVLQAQGRSQAALKIRQAQLQNRQNPRSLAQINPSSPHKSPVLFNIRLYLGLALGMILMGAGCFGQGYRQGAFVSISAPPSQPLNETTDTNSTVPISNSPSFQPWIYSLDTFLPGVNLHQESYWLPNSDRGQTLKFLTLHIKSGNLLQYYLCLHILSGYSLILLTLRNLLTSQTGE